MCTILFAYDCHPHYRLVVAANRDEFYRRPTAAAVFWRDHPNVLAGRDLNEDGTWMGVTTGGSFAALTNYRDPSGIRTDAKSRGLLVKDYLGGGLAPEDYLSELSRGDNIFNDYNLLLSDKASMYYYSSRAGNGYKVPAGVHGLSNASLNTPWPKVDKGIKALTRIVQSDDIRAEQLFALMGDRELPDDKDLPDTGVGLEKERILAPLFVASPDYGTCLTTVILMKYDHSFQFWERSYISLGANSNNRDGWDEVYYRYPPADSAPRER